jgi:drug/metabolite transporter (DMT)-like permease
MTGESRFFGYAAILTATITWATSGVFIKLIITSTGMSEMDLAFWRDSLTFILLFGGLLIFRRSLLRVKRKDLKYFAGLGCIGLGTFHLLWNYGVMLNGVAVSTVQQAVMPVVLAIAARLAFKEPLTLRKTGAILLTLTGAVFISGLITRGYGDFNVAGILVGFAIPVTYAAYNLFGKRITTGYHPLTILTYGFGFGTCVLLPMRFAAHQYTPFSIELAVWLAGLVIVSTIFPFAVYTFTLRKMQVSIAGILSMSEIPFAFLFAFILFGEYLTVFQYLGTLLIIVGISLFISLKKSQYHDTIRPS